MSTPRSQITLPTHWRKSVKRLSLVVFFTLVLLLYIVCKYPQRLVSTGTDVRIFYVAGKSPSFWYAAVYTTIVCGICLWVLLRGKNPYQRSKKKEPISGYQRAKFTSILFAQLVVFFVLPFVVPAIGQPGGFWNDVVRPPSKQSHVYVYPAFLSWKMAVYVFVVIPIVVWFVGKRYCSWFCACGNLAETVGVLPWGSKWVRHKTPRGSTATKWEWLQAVVLVFALFFGFVLLLDGLRVFSAPSWLAGLTRFQDFAIDFLFGSLIGVGAYPVLGTRIWCRYGCPLAQWMRWTGRWTRSRFRVVPNERCRGLGLCTQACPMGIDVASYAHRDGQPVQISFGLAEAPCIGCGGCIDVCPVDALSFAPIVHLLAPGGAPNAKASPSP